MNETCLRRKKNKAVVITIARNKTTPISVAAMPPTEMPPGLGLEFGDCGLVEVGVRVGPDGEDTVDEGEFLFRQLASLLLPTREISELPPCRP